MISKVGWVLHRPALFPILSARFSREGAEKQIQEFLRSLRRRARITPGTLDILMRLYYTQRSRRSYRSAPAEIRRAFDRRIIGSCARNVLGGFGGRPAGTPHGLVPRTVHRRQAFPPAGLGYAPGLASRERLHWLRAS